jgi:hypothetical protein
VEAVHNPVQDGHKKDASGDDDNEFCEQVEDYFKPLAPVILRWLRRIKSAYDPCGIMKGSIKILALKNDKSPGTQTHHQENYEACDDKIS